MSIEVRKEERLEIVWCVYEDGELISEEDSEKSAQYYAKQRANEVAVRGGTASGPADEPGYT